MHLLDPLERPVRCGSDGPSSAASSSAIGRSSIGLVDQADRPRARRPRRRGRQAARAPSASAALGPARSPAFGMASSRSCGESSTIDGSSLGGKVGGTQRPWSQPRPWSGTSRSSRPLSSSRCVRSGARASAPNGTRAPRRAAPSRRQLRGRARPSAQVIAVASIVTLASNAARRTSGSTRVSSPASAAVRSAPSSGPSSPRRRAVASVLDVVGVEVVEAGEAVHEGRRPRSAPARSVAAPPRPAHGGGAHESGPTEASAGLREVLALEAMRLARGLRRSAGPQARPARTRSRYSVSGGMSSIDGEPELLEEQRRGAEEHRLAGRLRAADLTDEAAEDQRPHGTVGADTPRTSPTSDPADGLLVGDDGERLERRGGQAARTAVQHPLLDVRRRRRGATTAASHRRRCAGPKPRGRVVSSFVEVGQCPTDLLLGSTSSARTSTSTGTGAVWPGTGSPPWPGGPRGSAGPCGPQPRHRPRPRRRAARPAPGPGRSSSPAPRACRPGGARPVPFTSVLMGAHRPRARRSAVAARRPRRCRRTSPRRSARSDGVGAALESRPRSASRGRGRRRRRVRSEVVVVGRLVDVEVGRACTARAPRGRTRSGRRGTRPRDDLAGTSTGSRPPPGSCVDQRRERRRGS